MTKTIETLKKAISYLLLSLVLIFVLGLLAMIISHTVNPAIQAGAMFVFWFMSFLGLSLILFKE